MARGHRQIEHTADLALEVWAPNEAELLVEAALGVTSLLTEGGQVQSRETRTVQLEVFDPEDRLVQWVNEVLYHALVKNFVLENAQVELGDGTLQATLFGQPDARHLLRNEIKSATYHDLDITHDAHGYRVRFVMDV